MSEAVIDGIHGALQEDQYVRPTDPTTLERLEWFQDQKLALMMHWGIYSQVGMVESWALSDKDGDWSRGGVDWTDDMTEFKQTYHNLYKSFNPVRFEPEKWADSAKDGGFKYLIFTTKHHDGFCMWDTKFSDYKITNTACPFHINKRADIVANVFDAFRSRDLGIAAYFSKADWNVSSYWANNPLSGGFTSRGPSYNPSENPEVWESFVKFTHDQVLELVNDYGHIDILWFDAGWVCRQNNQDIRIEELVAKAREVQPWLLSADRTVGGECENYITPEQSVPSKPLSVPWESCVSMGGGFAYSHDDNYKSTKTLLRMLIDIVAKGGNLALNVAPQTDGRLPIPALKRMKEMGAWLRQYGDAIYGTRICAPYKVDNFSFTQKAAENKVFAIYTPDTSECEVAKDIAIPYNDKHVINVKNMTTNKDIPFTIKNGCICVSIEKLTLDENYGGEHIAEVFQLTVAG